MKLTGRERDAESGLDFFEGQVICRAHKVGSRVPIRLGPAPSRMTLDNGSEFVGRAMEAWAIQTGVQLCFIRPGRPVEDGFIESFNGRLRDEMPRRGIVQLTTIISPHSSFDHRPPAVFVGLHGAGPKRFAYGPKNQTPRLGRCGFAGGLRTKPRAGE